jgi:NitT/TauT family transport system permease protein
LVQEAAAPRRSHLADVVVVCVLGGLLFAILNVAQQWKAPFVAETTIDLSFWKLPQYTLYSLARGCVAMGFSLVFAVAYASWAYYDARARSILLPVLDILQSIPVLGFMPGLVLALVSIFPTRNLGLELACVLMIFTAQVWNMVFSYYDSLKAIPLEMREVARLCGYTPWQRFRRIELPFAAQSLIYNCMVSMAGGWFFLTINEAFTLGDKNFQLAGIGSYMSVAIAQGNRGAEIAAVVAMGVMILSVDRLIWWPLVIWSRKFKTEDVSSGPMETTLVQRVLTRSHLFHFLGHHPLHRPHLPASFHLPQGWHLPHLMAHRTAERKHVKAARTRVVDVLPHGGGTGSVTYKIAMIGVLIAGAYGLYRLLGMIFQVSGGEWEDIGLGMLATFLRVLAALVVSSVWTIPVGVWIGLNPKVSRYLQPVIQFAASFPAPMLYPIVFGWVLAMGGNLNWGSGLLMMLGAQWYILFNVAAGAQSIPADMVACADIFHLRGWQRWRHFILPAIFPNLVTGWITSAGGAWNASIVAEYLAQEGKTYHAFGLGNLISEATNKGDFNLLAAAVVAMAVFVVAINRTFWKHLQRVGDVYCRFG